MRPNQIYPLGAAPAQAGEAEEHAAAPAMADGEETATAMRQPVLPSMHGSEVLLKAIKETGYKRLTLKSDQEPAIRALCNDVQNKFSGEIVPEASPKRVPREVQWGSGGDSKAGARPGQDP